MDPNYIYSPDGVVDPSMDAVMLQSWIEPTKLVPHGQWPALAGPVLESKNLIPRQDAFFANTSWADIIDGKGRVDSDLGAFPGKRIHPNRGVRRHGFGRGLKKGGVGVRPLPRAELVKADHELQRSMGVKNYRARVNAYRHMPEAQLIALAKRHDKMAALLLYKKRAPGSGVVRVPAPSIPVLSPGPMIVSKAVSVDRPGTKPQMAGLGDEANDLDAKLKSIAISITGTMTEAALKASQAWAKFIETVNSYARYIPGFDASDFAIKNVVRVASGLPDFVSGPIMNAAVAARNANQSLITGWQKFFEQYESTLVPKIDQYAPGELNRVETFVNDAIKQNILIAEGLQSFPFVDALGTYFRSVGEKAMEWGRLAEKTVTGALKATAAVAEGAADFAKAAGGAGAFAMILGLGLLGWLFLKK